MSKHMFTQKTEKGTSTVDMGWDNPVNTFFCNIYFDAECDEESSYPFHPQWTSLSEGAISTDRIIEKCKEYRIDLPEGLIDEVITDCCYPTPNRFVNWNEK